MRNKCVISATDHLTDGITGLTVIAIKQISTFMSTSFRNITVFSYPDYKRFFLTCKEELPTLMQSLDFQHPTDFDKMLYHCANMQTFAAHYSTRGIWAKLFTALIRVIFQHITLTLSEPYVGTALSGSGKNHYEASISRKTSLKKWYKTSRSLWDVTMAKLLRTNKMRSWPRPPSPVFHKYYYCSL